MLFLNSNLFAQVTDSVDTLDSLDSRVSDLEIRKIMERVKLGMEFSTFAFYSRSEQTTFAKKANFSNSNRLDLLFSSDISEDLSFYGDLRSFFYFNERLIKSTPGDSNIANQTGLGSIVQVLKAYFDYRLFNNTLIFSAGRLPTTDGPPVHFSSAVQRRGTYPISSFSLPMDGLALTWNIDRTFSSNNKIISRTIFSPSSVIATDNWKNVKLGLGDKFASNHNVFVQMFEVSVPKKENYWSDVLFILQGGIAQLKATPS